MDRAQIKVANSFGYGIQEVPGLKKVAHITYYKQDGTPLPNLPADPYHMERYLRRGFLLKAPPKIEEPKPPPVAESETPVAVKKHRKSRKSNKEK